MSGVLSRMLPIAILVVSLAACDDAPPEPSPSAAATATSPSATMPAGAASTPWVNVAGCVEPDQKAGVALSVTADGRSCVTWFDKTTDELEFVIRLEYTGSGERFEWSAPAKSTQFFIPADAVPQGEPGSPGWFASKDFSLQVVARTPRGEKSVGAIAVTVQ